MAVNRFTGATNNNWNTATNWSLGTVPTASDGHVVTFDATAANCTVNVAASCNNIDFTGYTGTLTMTNPISVSGNITFQANQSSRIAGSGQMNIIATGTITSNGGTWPNSFQFGGTSQTYTLADNMTITGTCILSGATGITINSNSITSNGLTASTPTSGTVTIKLSGGTWSGGALLSFTQLEFVGNSTMSGTITIGGSLILKYTSGTITTTGSTLQCNGAGASGQLNIASITLNNLTVGSSGGVLTLLADVNVGNNFSTGAGTSTTLNGATYKINVGRNITIANNGSWSGTISKIVWNGSTTGTWSGSGRIGVNLDINGTGTLTVSGTVGWGAATLTWIAGTVTTTGSTVTITVSGATINTGTGITWNNFSITLGTTTTLASDCYVSGTMTVGSTTSTTTLNGATYSWIVSGNFTTPITTGVLTGTATIKMVGTGNFSMTAVTTGQIRLPIEFAAGANTVTFNSSLYIFRSTTIIYTSGTIALTGSTVQFDTGMTFTVNATGFAFDTLNLAGSTTFSGTQGCSFNNLSCTTVGLTHTLAATKTYTVNTSLTLTGTAASRINFVSSVGGSQAIFTLIQGATQDVGFVNATDINSGAGQTIWDYKPTTLSNTVNWNQLTAPAAISRGYAT